jgi:hypothetical protein
MQVLDIPPQIYGLRWVRVLLNREFSIFDTLVIWDALFADSINLDLIDYLCVALLTYVRDFGEQPFIAAVCSALLQRCAARYCSGVQRVIAAATHIHTYSHVHM